MNTMTQWIFKWALIADGSIYHAARVPWAVFRFVHAFVHVADQYWTDQHWADQLAVLSFDWWAATNSTLPTSVKPAVFGTPIWAQPLWCCGSNNVPTDGSWVQHYWPLTPHSKTTCVTEGQRNVQFAVRQNSETIYYYYYLSVSEPLFIKSRYQNKQSMHLKKIKRSFMSIINVIVKLKGDTEVQNSNKA